MANLWADLRFALRSLRKSPVFTAVAVLSLALGIGANTAIFTLFDQILLRLLPVKNPRELVLLTMRGRHYGSNWGGNAISYPMYRDFRDHNQVFSGMFCRFPLAVSVGFEGQTERVQAELVSGTYFSVLGVAPSPAGPSPPPMIARPAATRSWSSATTTGNRASPRTGASSAARCSLTATG